LKSRLLYDIVTGDINLRELTMTALSHTGNLTEAIKQILEHDIAAGPEVAEYAHTATGSNNPEHLNEILNDVSHEYHDVLMELLFFPDDTARLKVEPFLLQEPVSGDDELCIIKNLKNTIQHISVRTLNTNYSIGLALPEHIICNYIKRLYLCRTPHTDILLSCQSALTPDQTIRISIFIRCKNIALTRESTEFTKRFIGVISSKHNHQMDLIQALLSYLDQKPEHIPLYDYLLHEKEKQKQRLNHITDFNEKLSTYSMDYLMMSGYQVPPDSQDMVQKSIGILEIILNEMNGYKQTGKTIIHHKDLGHADPDIDITNIFRLFDS